MAPADGQQRQIPLEGGIEQLELELVAELICATVPIIGLLAIALSRDVTPADHDQPVQSVHQCAGHASDGHGVTLLGHPVGQGRENHGPAASRHHHVEVDAGHQGRVTVP